MVTLLRTSVVVIGFLVLVTLLSPTFDALATLIGRGIFVFYVGWQLASLISKKIIIASRPAVSSNGKAVLITGCDSGFGHLSALTLNKAGFNVFAGCLSIEGDGAKKLKLAAKYPDRLHLIQLDITVEADIERCYKTISQFLLENNHQLWGLVNNAGILRLGEAEWGSFDYNFESIMNVNTFGPIKMTRKFLPLIRASRGRIINVNSTASRYAVPALVPYCVSKYASLAFTEGLRREMAKFAVKVISVEPFIYATQMATQDSIKSSSEKCWEDTEEKVCSAYGLHYFRIFRRFGLNGLTWATNQNPSEVSEAIFKAVTSSEPNFRYNCCNLLMRPFIWIGLLIPSELLEYLSRLGLKLIKRNRPLPDDSE